MKTVKYIAFLRGINVGSKKIIKMEDLSRMFASLGFENVKTYIQSGNVIFETSQANSDILSKKIENELHKSLGYEVSVMLRTMQVVKEMVGQNLFKKIKSNPNIKMYVSLFSR